MLIAGLGFGGAVVIFAVAVVDAMVVDTASEVVVTAETPAAAPAPVAYPSAAPADSYAGSPVGEARDPVSAPRERSAPGLEPWVAPTASPMLRRGELQRAVSQDPFQPDRRAPAQRYVLPGQRFVVAEAEVEETEAPDFRVVGAARIGGGGVALVQVDRGDAPVAVSVGESIEGYVLASVTEEGVTWTTEGGGSSVVPIVEPRAERRSNNGRDRNSRGRDSERELQQRVQELQGQMLEMIRGGGGGSQGRGVFRLNLDGVLFDFDASGRAGGRGGRGGGRGGAP